MTEELKPCPFCGNQPVINTNQYNEFFIQCSSCNSESYPEKTEDGAIYCWNRVSWKINPNINHCAKCNSLARDYWTKWGWAVDCSKCGNATGLNKSPEQARQEWNNVKGDKYHV